MKKHITYTALLVFIDASIQCSEDPYSGHKRISVKEYKTGQPLSEARISTYICEEPDLVFGCLKWGIFSTCVTDDRGTCRIRYPEFYFEGLKVEKADYWSRLIPTGEDEYAIQPKAWVKIRFSTGN